jgi:hypothetical protein
MENNEIFQLSDRYVEMRNEKQKAEEALKAISTSLDELEIELIQKMTDLEIACFKRNGVLFSVVSREYQSANPETKEELYKSLKKEATKTYLLSMPTPLVALSER